MRDVVKVITLNLKSITKKADSFFKETGIIYIED